jgi:hypothetical protein
MKPAWQHTIKFSLLLLILVVFSACRSQTPTQIELIQETEVRTSSPEPSPTTSPTPIIPSSTHTALPATDTSTPVPTSTITPTSTIEPPTSVINQDSVCRDGPGLVYDIRTYLNEGAVPILLGRDAESTWWSDVISIEGNSDSLPVFTPAPLPTPEPSPTQEQKGVFFYLIALDTGGRVGCGDTLIPVYTGVPSSGDIEKDIHNSLKSLLKLKVKDFGGLYNPLYNAHLDTAGVTYHADSRNVEVKLTGSIPKPKDECEYHRVRGVLWETVRQYSKVDGVTFWIGDKLVGDLIAIIDR